MSGPSVSFTISLFGDQQFDRELRRVGERGEDMSPAFGSIFDRLREINSEQMRSQGARSGEPYAPLKPATVAMKAKAGLDPDIEFATHELFNAMTGHTDPNQEVIIEHDWAVFRVLGDLAEGGPGGYGPVQQQGSLDGSLPPRPVFRLIQKDRVDIVKEMQRYVITGKLGNFLDI